MVTSLGFGTGNFDGLPFQLDNSAFAMLLDIPSTEKSSIVYPYAIATVLFGCAVWIGDGQCINKPVVLVLRPARVLVSFAESSRIVIAGSGDTSMTENERGSE